ncbi:hypothetical protein RsS62_00310 [Rhizobium dioscoreae]|uniref:Uncharacterized protein n=1 Tax=Rhizobium dioscoreae TaxID=2653122 RepID=A0ABQ0Z5T7_9HYPH|nr:hypothetical protein RsS62_00310 [Rhizobium dioscoreae]GES50906.1 hypothetical protein RsS93_35200 [Rhizobium dioscoreae]GLU82357.1 hypothetical protein Rhsp01_35330 [Rhizobium sp. NBRC 114257]
MPVAAIQLIDFRFLNMSGVLQHDRAQIQGRWRAMNRPFEAGFHQLRDKSRMIDMRMGQNDGVNQRRIEWERPVIQFLLGLGALEHATIDHYAGAAVLKDKARAGYRSGRTVEM